MEKLKILKEKIIKVSDHKSEFFQYINFELGKLHK